MKAVITKGNMDISYTDIEKPKITDSMVLVKVKSVGICGSDIPRVLKDACPVYPTVLGHEFSGIVVEVGEKVKEISQGERVVGIPLIPCFNCINCNNGNYGQCVSFKFIGTKLYGAMAEYVAVPEINVYKLSDNVTHDQGAFFEPVTVALHAIYNMEFSPHKSTAVIGAGTIGLLIIQCLKLMGAQEVFALDIDDTKLEKAKSYGADICINTKSGDVVSKVLSLTEGNGVLQVFECAGVEATIRFSLGIAAPKANIILVGIPDSNICLATSDFGHISKKELNIMGSWMSYSKEFPGTEWITANNYFSAGLLHVDNLIEQVISLEQVPELFNQIYNGRKLHGKILINL